MAGRLEALLRVVLVVALARTVQGATFTIDDVADLVDRAPGDGVCETAAMTCTLRAAIQEANALPGPDRVGVSNELLDPFTLAIAGAGEDQAASGDLDITEDLTIDGTRADPPALITSGLDAAGLDRAFHVLPGVTAVLTGLAVRDGATGPGEHGGGILNEGILDARVLVFTSAAGGDGGALYNAGTAVVTSRYQRNTAAGRGGAIANVGTLTIDGDLYYASILGNEAPVAGGIYNGGTLVGAGFSIMENHATTGPGGGLLNDAGAVAHLGNLTIGANTAPSGGEGIENLGNADLRYVTVNAHATLGVRNDDAGGAVSSALSSILGDACAGTVASGGYNVTAGCVLAGSAPGDQIGVDPELESHADCAARHLPSGCPYYRPRPGSPTIDAGHPTDCGDTFGDPFVMDQAAVRRPTGARCDAGAIESTPVCAGGRAADEAKLLVVGLGHGPGRQKVKFVARIPERDLPRLSFFGAQLAVEDIGTGTALVDRSAGTGAPLGSGGSIPFSCHRWRRSGAGYAYKEIDRNCPSPPPGALVSSLRVKDRSTLAPPKAPYVDVKVTVTSLTLDPPVGGFRVSFAYGAAAHFSTMGECAEAVFGPTACVTVGSQVKCRLL